MESLKVGHYTNLTGTTGLSVFLFDQPAVASTFICGASPATRESRILDLDSNANEINGLVFTGGSAFGLGAVDGVMEYLTHHQKGHLMPHGGVVPLVPAAAIYDLAIGVSSPPTKENAYAACENARALNYENGRIGAGTGATVGKLIPNSKRMSGGLGCAEMALTSGVRVLVYAVVNAVGDIVDAKGKIIAGAILRDGSFGNCEKFLTSGEEERYNQSNTTLIAIFTNVKFSKIELVRIAKMATAGMARAISPVFTRYDGDIIFAVSLGSQLASELTVGALAVEATRRAVLAGVQGSVIID